ncbi:MAG: hypothetical protein ACYC69_12330 [Thermodesulfovibrionales bacterium]
MDLQKQSCALCAWRETCQKKFSVSGRDVRCADFVKDLAIKQPAVPDDKKD